MLRLQGNLMKKKDERMKTTIEVLNGIKYIKMSGWEQAFLDKILKTREGELSSLKRTFVLRSVSSFTNWLTPMLITVVIVVTYILTGNELTAQVAFTLVSTVKIIQNSMLYLQWAITQIVESKVSLDRISKYLQAEDIKLDYIKKEENPISETAIKVENGNFYWLTEEEKMMKKEKENEKEKKSGDKATVKEEKKKTDKRKVSGRRIRVGREPEYHTRRNRRPTERRPPSL